MMETTDRATPHSAAPVAREPIAPPAEPATLAREVGALGRSAVLARSGPFVVFSAGANEIPHGLYEIGRLRELTFRAVGPPYAEMRHDRELAAIYRRNAEAVGRRFPELGPVLARGTGSTDMGNVSQVLPAIHPAIGIDSLPAANHQPEFAAHCITPAAERALLGGAAALAGTVVDVGRDAALRARLMARTAERLR